MIGKTIQAYFRLGRVHSAVLTGLAPVVTAAAVGVPLPLVHYVELFSIGALFHLFLFIYNEVRDVSIDKASKDLTHKPLVEGYISEKKAKAIVVSSFVLVFLFTLVFFFNQAFILILLSLLAFLFGGLYDVFGKRIPHADYFIATMLFFVALYGGFSVTSTVSNFVYVIALLAFTQMLINNIIAGLKDVDHDALAGGLSTPLRMHVGVEKGQLHISRSFASYIVLLKIIHITLTLIPFIYVMMSFQTWQLYAAVIIIGVSVCFLIRFLTMKTFNRESLMRAIGFHEMFAFLVVPVLLFSFIGSVAAIFLLIFPVIWLGVFLILMYGRLMPAI
ncbi:MAG: UbiA family prenyltransferase [Candidatus Thermoplasmatota archaeon]|nr:UbiA family prenyltransferase [Candidatus Thermoplasmatota archaeon]